MNGKIGLEEHFAISDTLDDVPGFIGARMWAELRERLLDLQDKRLAEMDRHGMEKMIISLHAPGVQRIDDRRKAIAVARRANDLLAEQISRRPDRFAGFAALAMQDPHEAAQELQRCVSDYGFKGALVNGYSQLGAPDNCLYYDLREYWDFWGVVEQLDVPFYLHPREPSQRRAYEGHPWLLGPVYGFAAETGLHALRLLGSGLFDRYPRLTLILGHLGEGLPFNLHRMDQRIAWSPMGYPAMRKISEYFQQNVYITTAGNFRTQTLIDCILEVGADRILFSTDYPFEQVREAAEWFDGASISEADRLKIGRRNALRLFKIEDG
ncbi:MAG TPA: amidohydrolase family protein [Steroidobacteraceae bacterium]|nr:amidohydrolase family protein [Steroidobacteraceae bacterium]